jgi:hypothetical protein
MNRRLLTAATVVLAMAAVMMSAAPWTGAFVRTGGIPVMLSFAVAAVVGVGVPVLLGRVLGWRLAVSVVALLAAWLVTALLVAVDPLLSVASLGDGISSALARMLQSRLPLVVSAGTLLPAFTLVFAVGAVMGELLTRTRVTLGLALAPVIGFAVGYAVTAQVEEGAGLSGATVAWSFVGLVLLGMLVAFRRLEVDEPTVSTDPSAELAIAVRSPLIAVALLSVATVAAFAVVNQMPDLAEDPAGLSSTPPVNQPVPDSPVDVLSNYRRLEGLVTPSVRDEVLLRVDIDRPSTGYLAVANLDDFDGASWRFDRLFEPTGFVVPDAPALEGDVITQSVEVVTALPLAEQWLVALDRPIEVPPIRVDNGGSTRSVVAAYDPDTGMVVAPVPLPAGTRYDVRSLAVGKGLNAVEPTTPVASATISPPGRTAFPLQDPNNLLDSWIGALTDATGFEPIGNVSSLVVLRDWMRTNFALVDDNIEVKIRDAGGNPEPVMRSQALLAMNDKILTRDGQATPEQLATTYVMLARRLGVPARIVTGFRVVPEDRRDAALPPGTYELTGAQAWTWAEVLIGDEGWVVVDPSPPSDQTVPPPTTTTIPEGSLQQQEIPDPEITSILPNPVAEAPPPITTSPPWFLIGLGLLVLIALLAAPVAGLIRRWRRRHGRNQGDPRQRIVGAWLETLDQLDEAALQSLGPLSATEVASAATERFGDEVGAPVAGVATLSNPALFSSAVMPEASAEEAWRNLEAARRALRRRLTVRQRFGATVRALRPRRWRVS